MIDIEMSVKDELYDEFGILYENISNEELIFIICLNNKYKSNGTILIEENIRSIKFDIIINLLLTYDGLTIDEKKSFKEDLKKIV